MAQSTIENTFVDVAGKNRFALGQSHRGPTRLAWWPVPTATIVGQNSLVQRDNLIVFTISMQVVRVPGGVTAQRQAAGLQ